MSDLLPCAHCGGDPVFHTVCRNEHFVECKRCGMQTDTVIADDVGYAAEIITERWNRRAQPPARVVVKLPQAWDEGDVMVMGRDSVLAALKAAGVEVAE